MRILVKIGGAQLAERAPRAALAESVRSAHADGHELILVHGGGNQIRQLSQRLGIPDRYVDGLRLTDAATAEVVLWVLAGEVNRRLVASLSEAGLSAVGLTGADGGTFDALPLVRAGAELGFVGRVHHVRPALVEALLQADQVPVIATVAPLCAESAASREHFYNINADHAVAPLASALEVDAILLLSDVPGVLEAGACLATMSAADCQRCLESGVITAGMVPKVESALAAAASAPRALVKIASSSGHDAIREALREDRGTRFLSNEDSTSETAEATQHG